MPNHQDKKSRIIRRKEVESITGLGRSTIYLRIQEGRFPRPINLGGRAVGWLENEIEGWLSCRIAASRGQEVEL
jgi:prophage regulatory protein